MTRRERHPVERKRIPAWTVIYLNTLRLVWRDPLFRLESLMLTLLTLLAAIATPLSPTPGDAAIQMTAIAYSVAPFFLVLIIGQLTVQPAVEAAWWNRPVAQSAYYLGRFMGLVVIGMILMLCEAVFGGIASAVMAHLAIVPSLIWNLGLMAGFALPSLVLVAGLCLWLAELTGGGHRYYPVAIILALTLAFAEYKLPTIAALSPRIVFFNPFPAFLALGLTMPPGLLGSPALPAWLLANRLAWIAVGVGLLALAMAHRHGYGRHYAGTGKWAAVLASFLGLSVVGGAMFYAPWVAGLSPKAASIPLAQGSYLLTRPDDVRMRFDAARGTIQGIETIPVPRYAVPPKALLLNRGLTIESVTLSGRPASLSPVAQGRVVDQTPAAIARLHLGSSPGGRLVIRFGGRLLPQPSPLPYAPFTPTKAYERLAVGQRRVFLDGIGTWFPVPLLPVGRGFERLPVKGRLELSIVGLSPKDRIVTNLHRASGAGKQWTGALVHPVLFAAPYQAANIGTLTILSGQSITRSQRIAYARYAQAWPNVARVLGISPTLTVVQSPTSLKPSLQDSILVVSAVHPYTVPMDPVTNATSEPSLISARAELADLWWQGRLSGLGTYAWQRRGMQALKLTPAFAVVTLLRSDAPATRKALYRAVKRHHSIPRIGTLNGSQTRLVVALAPLARTASTHAWARAFQKMAVEWPSFDNQAALASWLATEVSRS